MALRAQLTATCKKTTHAVSSNNKTTSPVRGPVFLVGAFHFKNHTWTLNKSQPGSSFLMFPGNKSVQVLSAFAGRLFVFVPLSCSAFSFRAIVGWRRYTSPP